MEERVLTKLPITLLTGFFVLFGHLVGPLPGQGGAQDVSPPRPIPRIEEPSPSSGQGGRWVHVGVYPIRFYGPRFRPGMATASTVAYRPNARIASVGWIILARLRLLQGEAFGVRRVCVERYGPCHTWGSRLRILDPATGRYVEVAVEDTGAGDGIDLPDETWRLFGYPPSKGRFWGDVWVRLE